MVELGPQYEEDPSKNIESEPKISGLGRLSFYMHRESQPYGGHKESLSFVQFYVDSIDSNAGDQFLEKVGISKEDVFRFLKASGMLQSTAHSYILPGHIPVIYTVKNPEGRYPRPEIEKVPIKFVTREADVLVVTSDRPGGRAFAGRRTIYEIQRSPDEGTGPSESEVLLSSKDYDNDQGWEDYREPRWGLTAPGDWLRASGELSEREQHLKAIAERMRELESELPNWLLAQKSELPSQQFDSQEAYVSAKGRYLVNWT